MRKILLILLLLFYSISDAQQQFLGKSKNEAKQMMNGSYFDNKYTLTCSIDTSINLCCYFNAIGICTRVDLFYLNTDDNKNKVEMLKNNTNLEQFGIGWIDHIEKISLEIKEQPSILQVCYRMLD